MAVGPAGALGDLCTPAQPAQPVARICSCHQVELQPLASRALRDHQDASASSGPYGPDWRTRRQGSVTTAHCHCSACPSPSPSTRGYCQEGNTRGPSSIPRVPASPGAQRGAIGAHASGLSHTRASPWVAFHSGLRTGLLKPLGPGGTVLPCVWPPVGRLRHPCCASAQAEPSLLASALSLCHRIPPCRLIHVPSVLGRDVPDGALSQVGSPGPGSRAL